MRYYGNPEGTEIVSDNEPPTPVGKELTVSEEDKEIHGMDNAVENITPAPNLSKESAQFLRNLLADQNVKVGGPDAQTIMYLATRALSELDAILGAPDSP